MTTIVIDVDNVYMNKCQYFSASFHEKIFNIFKVKYVVIACNI
jgi:hypothetical protein